MHLCFSFFNYITHIIITVIAFLLSFFFIIQRNPYSKKIVEVMAIISQCAQSIFRLVLIY